MKLSLVLASVDRTREPERFLHALARQTFNGFELIVIDQNEDDRLRSMVEKYRDTILIRHYKVAMRGASRARNIGIEHARGEIIAFPDDDCWYASPDLLQRVVLFFDRYPRFDGLSGKAVDADGRPSQLRWATTPGELSNSNHGSRTIEFTLFVRRHLIETVGAFDASLGPGSGTLCGCGEGADFVLRALRQQFRIWYDPTLRINHPQPVSTYDQGSIRRAYTYGVGTGHVWRRHGFPAWAVTYYCIRPFAAALLAASRGRRDVAAYYFATARGRVLGWSGRAA